MTWTHSLAPPAEAVAEPMSAIDRAWLEMDEPNNPMVVAAILEFEDATDAAALARGFVEKLLREPRFRQRVIQTEPGYVWLEDDAMHMGYHVQIRRLEAGTTDTALRAAVATELSHGLDRALPLWRINLFEHGEGRVTLLFRAHHAIADGIAMMQMLMQLSHGAGEAREPRVHVPEHHGPLAGFIQRLETVNSALENLTGLVVEDLRHPGRFSRQLHHFQRALAAVGRVVALPDDNPRRFRAPPGGRRAVAWTGNLSFAAVREFARAQSVTVNDVFLTALAGAFGRYLRGADGHLGEQQNLRVSVPVNLRSDGDSAPGNHFGLVLVDLPVGLEGWHARLDVISDRMLALKHSPEASSVLIALTAAGHLPVGAERQLVSLVGNKAAAVVSNLPGPRRALNFGAARLANLVFWPPQAARVGIGVSLLSYAGHVTVGISADTAQVTHPEEIIQAFCAELQAMLGRSPLMRAAAVRRGASASSTAKSPKGVNHVNP